ncbi:hypothetical protein AK812_SmicGene17830 [Symbiodinium microadriaticum]|uniref:Uncharacterized protein n=1 Tax=Symbiodinium microadriaticum TaxID=2951 RepID=A0A1Q9DWS0_SYMMI|nr:hypothetical protein AK812_SmicGene17830 [Symbiodinium microadriaticum]
MAEASQDLKQAAKQLAEDRQEIQAGRVKQEEAEKSTEDDKGSGKLEMMRKHNRAVSKGGRSIVTFFSVRNEPFNEVNLAEMK